MKLTREEKTTAVLDAIRTLDDMCFKGTDSPPATELLREFVHSDIFVLRFDVMKGVGSGPIVAYAIVNTDSPNAFLWQIAVAPQYQQRGYGTALLEEVIVEYQDRAIDLMVKIDNVGAQVLYLKNGFIVVRVFRNHFGPEEHGLLMRRENV